MRQRLVEWTAKTLVWLCGCTGSPEPSLFAFVICTLFTWTGLNQASSHAVHSAIKVYNYFHPWDFFRKLTLPPTLNPCFDVILILMTVAPVRVCLINMSQHMTKPTKWHVRPAKTQISMGIRPVWSESSASVSAWRSTGSLAILRAHNKDSDKTGWMPRLIWVIRWMYRSFCCFLLCCGS